MNYIHVRYDRNLKIRSDYAEDVEECSLVDADGTYGPRCIIRDNEPRSRFIV